MKYYDLLMMLRGNEFWNLMVALIVEEPTSAISSKNFFQIRFLRFCLIDTFVVERLLFLQFQVDNPCKAAYRSS